MSSKTTTTATSEAAKPARIPKLRFPEFRGDQGWKDTSLNEIADPVTERAIQGDEDHVLSLSAEHGLVLQSEFFGKRVAGDNSERYLKIALNDFVYNDRTTKASTFGTIKRLSKHSSGIVSPIYKCFRFHDSESPVFWEWYFESGTHTKELAGLVNEGARAGRFNISITQFLSTSAYRPDEPEQQKIAKCLSSVDKLISAQARKVDALKTHKKGLMQQLFPREGETQPRLRFPEFQNAGEWEYESLGDSVTLQYGESLPEYSRQNGAVPVVGSNGIVGYHNKALIKGPAIIIGRKGSYGQVTWIESDCFPIDTTFFVVNNRPSKNSMNFLYRVLQVSELENLGHQSAVPGLNRNEVHSLKVAMPKLAEQQRISSCLINLDSLITAEIHKLEALKIHKKGLVQQLFPSSEEVEG